MHSYSAERLVEADPERLGAALDELVARLWGPRATRLADEPARTYSVLAQPGDIRPDVFLSFDITPAGGPSRVRITLDEASAGPDPSEELNRVLDLLVANLKSSRPQV